MTDFAATDVADLAARRWSFGLAVLDERSLELRVGGVRVPLERKPLEVLLYLLHHAGEVVTKDDLSETLWPDRILTESVLARCVSVLRQALKDGDRTVIRTVHGYGYRLVADVRVEASAAAAPPAFDFKTGDHPPLRPQWKLVERLGTGGQGEAWLARHEKTGDTRVFKFALDTGSLTALKREITLYRLLHDGLGARAAVARVHEWNLSEPPYYIEMEHAAGGNLLAWSDAQGGLGSVAPGVRLEIAAQIAEALAAAHSVGALHKDLKPGNVLINVDTGAPAVRLCDFGSGSVLDPKRLEQLGITRLGFTKTLADGNGGGTTLYLAPEVVAGQPFTVQSDIYALGVLLYQLMTGDLRKALAPGWEADVTDELLREDIALAAAGNPVRRLTDASQLAERLRTLEARREVRAAEAAAKLRAERAKRIQGELLRMRVFALLLLGLSAVAIGGGVAAYRARNEAVAATATAKAIGDFLMEDVFRVDAGVFRPSEASYELLLDRAAEKVGVRLQNQPDAAASIHWMLGRRYQDIGRLEIAMGHYEQSVELFTKIYGEAAEPTLMALDRLAWIYVENGRWQEALVTTERIRTLWESVLLDSDPALLMVRVRGARVFLTIGYYAKAEAELREVLRKVATANAGNERLTTMLKQWLGTTLQSDLAPSVLAGYANLLLGGAVLEEFSDRNNDAQIPLRHALDLFSKTVGEDAELTALANTNLAMILGDSGETAEAERRALIGANVLNNNLPPQHYAHGLASVALGRVRLGQLRVSESINAFRHAVDLCVAERGCPPRVRAHFLFALGLALNEGGRGADAVPVLRASLEIQGRLFPANNVGALRTHLGLIEALRQTRALEEASAILNRISEWPMNDIKPTQEVMAQLYRVSGLVLFDKGEFADAATELKKAHAVLGHRFGSDHWRTKRAHIELMGAVDQGLK